MCVYKRYRYIHQTRHFGNITCPEFTMADGQTFMFWWWHLRVVFLLHLLAYTHTQVKCQDRWMNFNLYYIWKSHQESSITEFWWHCSPADEMACVSISATVFVYGFIMGNLVQEKKFCSRLPNGLARRILGWISNTDARCPMPI